MIRRSIVLLSLASAVSLGFAQATAPSTPSPVVAPAAAPGDAAGHWEGTIAMPGTELGVIVDLKRGNDAAARWTGKIDIPMQGAMGLDLEKIAVEGGNVSFAIKGIPGAPTFNGKFGSNGTIIEGTMTQGGFKLPFTLTRERTVSNQLTRPQEPKPPYPYREEEVVVPSGEFKLAGTLTTPQGAGPFPAAVLITGSGPQNRDEELFGHKPFKVWADHLTRAGVAVLRVDDRGTGASTGEFEKCTSADFANDVESCVAFLKTRSEVARDRIGLVGHSEGALIAPIVAGKPEAGVAFVVLFAAPGRPGHEVLAHQLERILSAGGMAADQVAKLRDAQTEILAILRESEPNEVEAKLKEALLRQYETLPPEQRSAVGEPEAFVKTQIDQVNTPWMRYFVSYDPRESLRQLKSPPVLAVWGTLDLQVDPEQNAPDVEESITQAGNADATFKRLDGLNHLFQPATTGGIDEYGQIETTIDESALAEISGWIVKRFVK